MQILIYILDSTDVMKILIQNGADIGVQEADGGILLVLDLYFNIHSIFLKK